MVKKTNLLAEERREQMIRLVNSSGSMRAAELADYFGVSGETIRKDLALLNGQGLLKKSFGGAVSLAGAQEIPVSMRAREHSGSKAKIAMRAAEFLSGQMVVYIDAGSTALEFAKLVPDGDLVVVTSSVAVLNQLAGSGVTVYFTGGEFSSVTMSVNGLWTKQSISSVAFDLAVLGSSGFEAHTGPGVKLFSDAQTKKEVLRHAKTKLVLADSSKFTKAAIVQYAQWAEIDALITDSGAPGDWVRAHRDTLEIITV
ncbi:DeoR/GlpR family DNA-binding transcription regulator [Christensenella tenuis]|uniref:Lactose phosphotransferase system repressor n=1 Tax=Christensenella tenuis TaxID=2763033 RepID=A0ABR7EGL3_9FIRM|nr:DeoR/GlpR family DNA-binding transcription regulator [Christensenella tenuis]MBC5648531.1 DeoR/GlpR transcriptional regulator [Christensenella tenuis]